MKLETGQMFKNPFDCDAKELENVVCGLEDPVARNVENVLPFKTNIEHYQMAREVLQKISEISGQKYNTIGEYILSRMPNEIGRAHV